MDLERLRRANKGNKGKVRIMFRASGQDNCQEELAITV